MDVCKIHAFPIEKTMERQYMAICGFHMAISMLYKTQIWPIDYPISHSFISCTRGNQDAYDTNKMAEEFTHFFYDRAFSVGQQVNGI